MMHDPMTVAFEIKSPIKRNGYRSALVTIWHVDPETDGSDDSCGWFIRGRHLDQVAIQRVVDRYEMDWDRTFEGKYLCGLFVPNGEPHYSVPGIVINLFFWAACEYFASNGRSNWRKARRFMQDNLFDILHFAENPTDSLRDGITRKFEIGCNEKYTKQQRDERIRYMASCIYSWIARSQRPWYRHPRWHFWHWKIQVHPLQSFKQWAFSRCEGCGKGFSWGYCPTSSSWHGTGPLWFCSEKGIYHTECCGSTVAPPPIHGDRT